MRTTAKAVVKLFRWANRKAWRLFVVKRATSRVIGPSFFKRHAFINHVDNVHAIKQVLDKAFRDQVLAAFYSFNSQKKILAYHNANQGKGDKGLEA